MVIKAALLKLDMVEVPATLSPDLRQRAPHLRPWRDGWRHLRYLFMLSPTWVFGVPGLVALVLAAIILGTATAQAVGLVAGPRFFGASWSVVGAFLATCGHFCLLCAAAMHLHGVRSGYRRLRPMFARFAPVLTLEHTLMAGGALVVLSMGALGVVGTEWASDGFTALDDILPLVVSVVIGAVGVQTLVGAFLLAIIAGNDNRFAPRG
jgi:hypothetical protein